MYFGEMIRKEMKTSEFSEMESTDEIIEKIRENTLNSLEEQADFMKEFPNPTYAVMRLDYLSQSEEHSSIRILYSKLLKAREQMKGQEEKKESVLGAIKKYQAEDKEKPKEKKEASKEAER